MGIVWLDSFFTLPLEGKEMLLCVILEHFAGGDLATEVLVDFPLL